MVFFREGKLMGAVNEQAGFKMKFEGIIAGMRHIFVI
jgi:hypothetical protein